MDYLVILGVTLIFAVFFGPVVAFKVLVLLVGVVCLLIAFKTRRKKKNE